MNSRCLKPSCFDSSNVDMNSKGLYVYHISRKEKSVAVLCSRPRQNVKLARPFHVVVVQRRLRNVQKRVMHVPSCCFAIAFLPFSLPSPSSMLKLPNVFKVDRPKIILVAKKYISTSRNCSSVGCLKCVQFHNWFRLH